MFKAILSLLTFTASAAISCLGETGDPVDTWTILKAPQTGDRFLYAETDIEGYQGPLFTPTYSLNSTAEGGLSLTMKQLWESDVSYLIWNDGPPNTSTYNYTTGHTKGILALSDDGSGFWLSHSFPSWPVGPSTSTTYKGLTSNLWTYGQNAYCFSISASTANILSYALQLTVPNIYDSRISDAIGESYKNISNLAKGSYSKAAICAYYTIETNAGQKHTFYSKSTQWNKDLWYSCVAPQLQKGLVVESWIRGSAIGPSCSGTYEVLDASSISFNPDFAWSEYNDHSKWAASSDQTINCFGDINRMTTQYERGGSAVCFAQAGKGYSLLNAVSKENSC
jgi:deoxyribonuclease-2